MQQLTNRRAMLALAAGCLAGRRVAQAATGLNTAPELLLRASDGLPVLAAPATARATWVDFWASWCAPCKLAFPWMNQMHERHAAGGLRIVAINLDKREADAQRFLQQVPALFALAFDPEAATAKAMQVQTMPSSFLMTPDRRIVLAHRGFRLQDRAALELQIRTALGS